MNQDQMEALAMEEPTPPQYDLDIVNLNIFCTILKVSWTFLNEKKKKRLGMENKESVFGGTLQQYDDKADKELGMIQGQAGV